MINKKGRQWYRKWSKLLWSAKTCIESAKNCCVSAKNCESDNTNQNSKDLFPNSQCGHIFVSAGLNISSRRVLDIFIFFPYQLFGEFMVNLVKCNEDSIQAEPGSPCNKCGARELGLQQQSRVKEVYFHFSDNAYA